LEGRDGGGGSGGGCGFGGGRGGGDKCDGGEEREKDEDIRVGIHASERGNLCFFDGV